MSYYSSSYFKRDGRGSIKRSWTEFGQRRNGEAPVLVPVLPLGQLLEKINIERSNDDEANGIKLNGPRITDCEVIASYNWINESKASIAIPGQCYPQRLQYLPQTY